jgi:hypothetical protein
VSSPLPPLANRAESALWRYPPSLGRYPNLRVMERNMKIPYERFPCELETIDRQLCTGIDRMSSCVLQMRCRARRSR